MIKKMYMMLVFLLAISFLQGCNNPKGEVRITDKEEDYFVYPMPYFKENFYVDDAGLLYYPTEVELDEPIITDEGLVTTVSNLNVIDHLGNPIKTYALPFFININYQVLEGILYYAYQSIDRDNKSTTYITAYNLEDETLEVLAELNDDIRGIVNFEVTSQGIYLLAEDKNLYDKSYLLADPMDSFFYKGEFLAYLDFDTLTITRMDVEFPISFSTTVEEKALVYGYDEEQGYYFVECDGKTNQVSKKMYKNLRNLKEFACTSDKDIILYQFFTLSETGVAAISVSKNEQWELFSDAYVGLLESIVSGDYLYYRNWKYDKKLERINYKDYMTGNNTIHMISASMEAFLPFGAGFKLSREFPSLEEFALTVLSNDSNFDIAILHSGADISENIRNKGSFYPLNEVEGVKEYLDVLFPYIKDAATTEDGDVWMIPLTIDIPFLLYNEENCEEAGFEITDNMDIKEFADIVKRIRGDDTLKDKANYKDYPFIDTLFDYYIREYKTFDSDLFLLLAKEMKDAFNPFHEKPMSDNFFVENELYEGSKRKPLFVLQNTYTGRHLNYDSIPDSLHASKFPQVGEKTTSVVNALFLTVNPASKNLEESLNYISKLCQHLIKSDSTKIFRTNTVFETDLEKEISKIYADGEIVFRLPKELYIEEVYAYLQGELGLADMIKEGNRKLNIYLKE